MIINHTLPSILLAFRIITALSKYLKIENTLICLKIIEEIQNFLQLNSNLACRLQTEPSVILYLVFENE